jgi:monovalent cation:H+ antiporter-2, CPA2 family
MEVRLVRVLAAVTTHDVPLVATIAVSLAFAFVGGLLAVRLRLPPLVGYLLAGIVVGPFTPGFVADAHLAPQLAEIGVILLMFGVGTHFSIRDLFAVRRVALPGAFTQIIVATALGAGVATWWRWSFGAGILFGLSLSVASTVVLLRALEDRDMIKSNDGRIAIGWLIVEDLLMVLTLVLLPALSGVIGGDVPNDSGSLWPALGITIGKVVLFIGLMLIAGVRFFPWLLSHVEKTGSRELFTLAVIALALGVAFCSAKLFGVSFAPGCVFRRSGVERIRFESSRGEGASTAAGCIHGFIFCCGRNVIRSLDPDPATASGLSRACDRGNREIVSRFRDCSNAGRPNANSTYCVGCVGADR